MRVHFDPRKNERNIRERGLSLEAAADFDFDGAWMQTDTRRDYGETRYVAIGWLGDRLHVRCFAEEPDGIRVISLRKANSREVARYAEIKTAD